MNTRTWALLQMNSQESIADNTRTMIEALEKASQRKAKVLFTPENCLWMGKKKNLMAAAAHIADTKILKKLQAACRAGSIALHIGSYPELQRSSDKCYNTSLFIRADGKILGKYRKRNLFEATLPSGTSYKETDYFVKGRAYTCTTLDGMKIGSSICFDVRFARHYRALMKRGAECVVVPSAFTYETGLAHWHVLLRARAIETFSFIVAAAQVGKHAENRRTYGHSLVVNPWGHVLLDAGDEIGLHVFTWQKEPDPKKLRRQFSPIFEG